MVNFPIHEWWKKLCDALKFTLSTSLSWTITLSSRRLALKKSPPKNGSVYRDYTTFSWMHAGVITDPDPNLFTQKHPPQKKTVAPCPRWYPLDKKTSWSSAASKSLLLRRPGSRCKVGVCRHDGLQVEGHETAPRNGLKINKWVWLGWKKLYLYQHIPISSMYGIFTSTCTKNIKHPM